MVVKSSLFFEKKLKKWGSINRNELIIFSLEKDLPIFLKFQGIWKTRVLGKLFAYSNDRAGVYSSTPVDDYSYTRVWIVEYSWTRVLEKQYSSIRLLESTSNRFIWQCCKSKRFPSEPWWHNQRNNQQFQSICHQPCRRFFRWKCNHQWTYQHGF